MVWVVVCKDTIEGDEVYIDSFDDELSAYRFKKEVMVESWVRHEHVFEVRPYPNIQSIGVL